MQHYDIVILYIIIIIMLNFNNFINESKFNVIKDLYHGSGEIFNKFLSKSLGEDEHLLSYLGFHFTPNFKLAERLFTKLPDFVVYTVEIKVKNTLKIIETKLVLDMLQYAYDNKLINQDIDIIAIKKLPYFNKHLNNDLLNWLYKNPEKINKKKLSLEYKKYLISQGYDSIEYLNEVEWSDEKRYDWIVFNTNQIKIINIYKQ